MPHTCKHLQWYGIKIYVLDSNEVALNFEIQEADVEMKELQKEIRESTISSGEERTNYCTVNGWLRLL